MPKPTLEELERTAIVKPSFEDLERTAIFRSPTDVVDPNEETKKFQKTIDDSEKLKISLSDSEDYQDSLEKIEKKKPIGFWEGITEDALFKIPVTGPMLEGLDLARIKLAAIRLNTPDFDWEEESEREKRRLDWEYGKPGLVPTMSRQEYLDRRNTITAESARQDDIDGVSGYINAMAEREERGYNFWGRVGQGLSVLPAWMFEFALTAGLYKTSSVAVKTLLQKHARGKLIAKTGGWLAGSAVRTTVGMPQRVFANSMRRSLNKDEGWATSIAMGWGETFIEAASEQAGQTITGALSYVAGGAINKLPFGSKFLSGLQKVWTKLAPDNTAAKFAKKIATKAGYSNLIGEIGEERLATILHGLVGTETFGQSEGADSFDRILAGLKEDFKVANVLSEAVVLSVPGAIKFSLGQLGKFADDTQLRKAIETEIGVSPEAAKKAVEIKNKEGIEEADKYISDVKSIGEKAVEKVLAEEEARAKAAEKRPSKPGAPITKPKAVEVAPEKIIHKIRESTPEEIAEDEVFWESFPEIMKGLQRVAERVPSLEALQDTLENRIDLLKKVQLGILTQKEADALTKKFVKAAKLRIESKALAPEAKPVAKAEGKPIPAVRLRDGSVITGENHGEIVNKLKQEGKIDPDKSMIEQGFVDGWVVKGQFYDTSKMTSVEVEKLLAQPVAKAEPTPVVEVIKSPELEYKDEYRDYLQSDAMVRKLPVPSERIPIERAARIRQEVERELRGAKPTKAEKEEFEDLKEEYQDYKWDMGSEKGQRFAELEKKIEKPEEVIEEKKKKLSDSVSEQLSKGEQLDAKSFFALADEYYGGTRAEGKYQTSQAYDELELGVNKYIQQKGYSPTGSVESAQQTLKQIEEDLAKLPTQTTRTGEKELLQQFSTPPHYAYALNWIANIQADDVVLEPSAGTGSLAVYALNTKARVYVNEISKNRAELLKELGFVDVFSEDAEQIHNILDIKPDVVVMNPPFSTAGTRMPGQKLIGMDLKHIDAALELLSEKGRLVAIIGQPLHFEEKGETKTFQNWYNKVKEKYNVLANINVARGVYKKYGTAFPTRVLVIDKTGPTTETKTGNVDSISDLLYTMEGAKNERTIEKEPKRIEPTEQVLPAERERPAEPGTTVRPTARAVGRKEPGPERPMGEVAKRPPDTTGYDVELQSPTGGENAVEPITRPEKPEATKISGVSTGKLVPELGPQEPKKSLITRAERKAKKELTANVFEPYLPPKFAGFKTKKHPASLVESAPMAAVKAPDVTYVPNIDKKIIEKGLISDIQLEAIASVGHAHEQMLPDEISRKAYMIGDGTGVGKGREIAGVILDNWNQGRKKVVWISESQKLFQDAVRDWTGIGQDKKTVFNQRKIKSGTPIQAKEGILYTTYSTLRSKPKIIGSKARKEQITDWLGENFDGLVIFDESHNMANAVTRKGFRGKIKPSSQALAGMDLQRKMPNARILYVSATGATEVHNLAYAMRLGLWGQGTSFPNQSDFINKISESGIAAMELVARDMKAMGLYTSRNISFNDGTKKGTVEYERLVHTLSSDQRIIYDKLADAWQIVLQNVDEALEITGGKEDGHTKAAAHSQFWGSQQRFFNQVLTAIQTPSVIKDIEKNLANDKSVVLQIQNTLEAAQERALAQRELDEDLEDFDITPRETLMQYVENSFPTAQYEKYYDEDGNMRSRIVLDSKGNPIENRAAVQMREKLLDDLGSIRVPDSPLDMIINYFDSEKVAEVTGRKRRVIKMLQPDGTYKKVVDKRSLSSNSVEIERFMSGKKRILIFSQAGGTGASYHADLAGENQQQRVHYVLQPGWRADKCIQGMGRTHRSNQASAPVYKLVTTNLKGQLRFISTIARRLDQLGALTKGERRAGSTGLFSASDNLESNEAREALRIFFSDMVHGGIEDIDVATFETQSGLKLTDERGNLLEQLPPMRQFLNRLLAFNTNYQDQVFEAFDNRLKTKVEQAVREGTLDQGVEVYRADRIEKETEETIYTHPESGAETKYVRLKVGNKISPITWDEVEELEPSFYVHSQKGKIYAVREAHATTEERTGRIVEQYRLTDQVSSHFIEQRKVDYGEQYEKLEKDKAQEEWNSAVSKVPEFREKEEHMISGLILPIWDRLRGKAKVYRFLTNEGEEIIGRLIPARDISRTLEALGASASLPKITPERAAGVLISGDANIELANQWRLKHSRVAGESRIELTGPSFQYDTQLEDMGIFKERIQYSTRYFIPTNRGAEIIEKLSKQWPIASIEYHSKGMDIPEGRGTQRGMRPGFIYIPPLTTTAKIEQEHPNIKVITPQKDIGVLQKWILTSTNQARNSGNPLIIAVANEMADRGLRIWQGTESQLSIDKKMYNQLPKKYRENKGSLFFSLMDKYITPEMIDEAASFEIPKQVKPILKHFKNQDEIMRQEIIRQKREMVTALYMRKNLPELQEKAKEKKIPILKYGRTKPINRTKLELSRDLARKDITNEWGRKYSHIQHIFFGQYQLLFEDLEGKKHFIGRAETQAEAFDKLATWKQARRDAGFDDADKVKLIATPEINIPLDVMRISRKHFFWLEEKLQKAADTTRQEIDDALRGIIGKREAKQKWWGALMRRKGAPGYSEDFLRVWAVQATQFNRWKHLTAMNRVVEPMIEKIRGEGLRGWAQYLEDTKDFVWGRKRRDAGRMVDEWMLNIPVVKNYVKPFAIERWAGLIKSVNYWRHLQTGRFYVINSLQTIQTLWPIVGEKGLYNGIKLYYSKTGQDILRKYKVGGIAGKLHEIGMKRTRKYERMLPAGASEIRNQGIAFLALYDEGKKRGMTDESAARYGRLRGQLFTQFTYTPSDIPKAMRGPVGGLILQYKRFTIKNLELVSRLARDGNWGGVARWVAAITAIGGLSTFLKAISGLPMIGYLTYKLYKKIEDEYGKETADVVHHGLPGLVGIDMSGSITPIDVPYGENIYEKTGNLVFGPTGTTAVKIIEDVKRAKVAKEIGIVPRALKSFVDSSATIKQFVYLVKALEKDTANYDAKQRTLYKLETWDLWKKAFGFRAETETIQRMQFEAMIDLKKEYDETIDHVVLALIDGDAKEAGKLITDWHASFPEAPISADSITRRLQERNLARMLPMTERAFKELPEALKGAFVERE